MITLLEIVRRCKFCEREMKVSSRAYAENPYCHHCLSDRLAAASLSAAGTEWVRRGHYLELIPTDEKVA